MRRSSSIILSLIVCALLQSLQSAGAAEEPQPFTETVQPLLQKYCYKCHGNREKVEANFNLATITTHEQALQEAKIWERVARRVRPHEMPPETAPQLDTGSRRAIIKWIESLPDYQPCEEIAGDQTQLHYKGEVMSRRLTRAEYNNSVRDLLGVDLQLTEMLPSDGGGGEGFDTNGSTLFSSAIGTQKYLDVAEHVVLTLLPEKPATDMKPELRSAQKKLLGDMTTQVAEKKLEPREAARKILVPLARRAFRHPASDEEIERLLAAFDQSQKRGGSFVASVRQMIAAVLISPHFLFLVEPEPNDSGIYQLDDFRLATRISYFLWSSIPDEELLALAEAGKLKDKEVLRAQVRRMLRDEKVSALADHFAVQWLGLSGLGVTSIPDKAKYPEYDAELAAAMPEETRQLFLYVVRENRPLTELFGADYIFVNARLAKHYEIADVTGNEFRKLAAPTNRRGGVLTQAAVLTTTSYPLRTSPVLRGRWVLESILGDKVPPPPPDVPSLPEDDPAPKELTMRQRLEEHRKKAECSSCHKKMDPLGFGLENFDPLGRWRDELGGLPIDTQGKMPSGEEFNGPNELAKLILQQKEDVLRHLVRKLLGYALGRELNRFDQCAVDDTMKALIENESQAATAFEELILSFPFQHRYAKK